MNLINQLYFFIRVTGKNIVPIERSVIDFYHLTIILKGKFTYVVNGKEITVEENDALLLPACTDRERYPNPEFADFILFNFYPAKNFEITSPTLFKNAVTQPIRKLLDTYPYTFYYAFDNKDYTGRKFRHYREYSAHESQKVKAILHNIFNCILIDLFDFLNYKTKNPHVVKILKYIDDNITSSLTLHNVSNAVHLSKAYTARVFKKEMNMTLSEYVNRQKLSIAKNMMTNNQLSLQDIAERLGYQNYNYFSRLFKEFFGITPMKMKNELKKY